MYAFAPAPILTSSFTPQRHAPSSRPPPLPRTAPRWRAKGESSGPRDAIKAGEEIRSELRALSEQRQAQAARTSAALSDMSLQLSKIVAKLRSDAGMPPVADPPVDEKDEVDVGLADAGVRPGGRRSVYDNNDVLDDGASDEPYMDPKNFGYESTAGWQVLAGTDELPETEGGNVEFRIECDMHGCSLIEVRGEAAAGPGVRERYVQAGSGFRVGYDPEAPKSFCGMVGNEQWLLALNYDEMRHFKRLCLSLKKKMERIGRGEEDEPKKKPAVRRSGDGMFNMRVVKAGLDCSVELESKLVWVQAIGQPVVGQYCVRAIFMEGRQGEGFWAMDAAPAMIAALNKLGID